MLFELSVIISCVVILYFLRKDSLLEKKFIVTFLAVFFFEYFTHPLWINRVDWWAYIPLGKYVDISWVIALGWTMMILTCTHIVDLFFGKEKERKRFVGYLVLVTVAGLIAEGLVLYFNVREYSYAVKDVLSGMQIFGIVPIEALYYIPAFMILVISASRYLLIITLHDHASQATISLKKPNRSKQSKRKK